MKKVNCFLIIILAAALFGGSGCSTKINPVDIAGKFGVMKAEHKEIIVKNIPVAAPVNIKVSEIAGSIKITFEDIKSVKVTAEKCVRAKSQADAERYAPKYKMIVKNDGSGVEVRTEYPKNWLKSNGWIDYEIVAPKGSTAKVSTVSGDVIIGRGSESVRAETTSGDIEIFGAGRGGATARSTSGDISASNVSGGTDVKTTSGDIKIAECGGKVKAVSTSGSIDVKSGKTGGGEIELKTVSEDISYASASIPKNAIGISTTSGDVSVALPEKSDLDISVGTISGDINCELPSKSMNKQDRSMEARIGAGGNSLQVKTISGDVLIKKN